MTDFYKNYVKIIHVKNLERCLAYSMSSVLDDSDDDDEEDLIRTFI